MNYIMLKKPGVASFMAVFTVILVTGVLLFAFRKTLRSWFDPVSVVASVTGTDLKETDGRTNILILGSDKRSTGAVASELTDTILIASIGKLDKDVVLISIPRDLWVSTSKINAVYATGGALELSQTVESVLGIPIHYYALVTFNLFKDTVNTLGGVQVTVDQSFTDYYYPIEGKEDASENERYETVRFEAGPQTMDGDTALKFARSRKGDNEEGTDFARSKRQQKVITAIKDKVLTMQTLVNPLKLKELYDIYSQNVDTNITLRDIQVLYALSQQISFDKVTSIVLDDRSNATAGGLLYAPEDMSLYGGQYVLLPQTGDFSQIHAYVQQYLFSQK